MDPLSVQRSSSHHHHHHHQYKVRRRLRGERTNGDRLQQRPQTLHIGIECGGELLQGVARQQRLGCGEVLLQERVQLNVEGVVPVGCLGQHAKQQVCHLVRHRETHAQQHNSVCHSVVVRKRIAMFLVQSVMGHVGQEFYLRHTTHGADNQHLPLSRGIDNQLCSVLDTLGTPHAGATIPAERPVYGKFEDQPVSRLLFHREAFPGVAKERRLRFKHTCLDILICTPVKTDFNENSGQRHVLV
eukprot:1196370-Prorocentrum_minimum.AAC.1